eukprot:1161988-Pelagomonas_calceolata.AAC.4
MGASNQHRGALNHTPTHTCMHSHILITPHTLQAYTPSEGARALRICSFSTDLTRQQKAHISEARVLRSARCSSSTIVAQTAKGTVAWLPVHHDLIRNVACMPVIMTSFFSPPYLRSHMTDCRCSTIQ